MHRSSFMHLASRQKIVLRTLLWLASVLLIFLALSGTVTNRLSFLDYASLKQNGFYMWAVLFLCVAWVFVKRSDILRAINDEDTHAQWLLVGVLLFGASVALLYRVALSPSELAVGLFAIFFTVVASFALFSEKRLRSPLC